MRAIHKVLIKSDKSHINQITTEGGQTIFTNTSIETIANMNRQAEVLDAPSYSELLPGDQVIVHHNIMSKWNDIKGVERDSDNMIKKGLFWCPLDLVFLYKRGDQDWKCLSPYVFINPDTYDRSAFTGKVEYTNKELESKWGIKKGDRIIYKDHWNEHAFERITSDTLYKMKTIDIISSE